jgi:hypothetical protein
VPDVPLLPMPELLERFESPDERSLPLELRSFPKESPRPLLFVCSGLVRPEPFDEDDDDPERLPLEFELPLSLRLRRLELSFSLRLDEPRSLVPELRFEPLPPGLFDGLVEPEPPCDICTVSGRGGLEPRPGASSRPGSTGLSLERPEPPLFFELWLRSLGFPDLPELPCEPPLDC